MPTTIHRNINPMNGAGSETPTDASATAILSGHFPRLRAAADADPHAEDQKYRCGTDSDRQRVGQRRLDCVPDRPVVLERRTEAGPAAPVPTVRADPSPAPRRVPSCTAGTGRQGAYRGRGPPEPAQCARACSPCRRSRPHVGRAGEEQQERHDARRDEQRDQGQEAPDKKPEHRRESGLAPARGGSQPDSSSYSLVPAGMR